MPGVDGIFGIYSKVMEWYTSYINNFCKNAWCGWHFQNIFMTWVNVRNIFKNVWCGWQFRNIFQRYGMVYLLHQQLRWHWYHIQKSCGQCLPCVCLAIFVMMPGMDGNFPQHIILCIIGKLTSSYQCLQWMFILHNDFVSPIFTFKCAAIYATPMHYRPRVLL